MIFSERRAKLKVGNLRPVQVLRPVEVNSSVSVRVWHGGFNEVRVGL